MDGPVEAGGRYDELAAQTLMVALSMVVLQIRVDCSAQVALAEEHELVEALARDGTDEALDVIVEVGTVRRQARWG
jgi:hypothetical protein